jgi:para-aminobenzoate synthetase component 1
MSAVAIRQAPIWRDPIEALSPFADEPHAVLLHSGAAGWSYLMRRPRALLEQGAPDPFAALARLIDAPGPVRPEGPPFQGGVVGLAAYELAAHTESLALGRTAWPDLYAAAYDAVLAFDGPGRRVLAIGRGETPAKAETMAGSAMAWLDAPVRPVRRKAPVGWFEPDPPQAYEAAVRTVTERIAAGDIFQANIARSWRGRLEPGAAPFDLFARLAGESAAPFAAYLSLPGRALVSNAPERFLRLGDGEVTAQPIKGTRPRGATPGADAALATELLASLKDRAENLMIVDLMRNDLARVCVPGSVRVDRLFELQSFANVHHLVSTVRGRLHDGAGAVELLRAAFPPGSITGAPKIQAMKVIAGLEAPRGPYCGSLFWAGADGAMESSVLIRTVLLEEDEGGWSLEARAGAGIVADSDPASERRETEHKMAAIARALTEAA